MPRDKNGPLPFLYFAGFHQMPIQIIKTDDTLSPAIFYSAAECYNTWHFSGFSTK